MAESIYNYNNMIMDYRLNMDPYMQIFRAHVFGHECLCGRAHVCVSVSPSIHIYGSDTNIRIYINMIYM